MLFDSGQVVARGLEGGVSDGRNEVVTECIRRSGCRASRENAVARTAPDASAEVLTE